MLTPVSDLVISEIDGEAVVFVPATTSLHLLNSIATVIWTLLSEHAAVEDLVSDLAEAYSAPESVIAADVAAVIDEFVSLGLLLSG